LPASMLTARPAKLCPTMSMSQQLQVDVPAVWIHVPRRPCSSFRNEVPRTRNGGLVPRSRLLRCDQVLPPERIIINAPVGNPNLIAHVGLLL
jgi:hypothetical protein